MHQPRSARRYRCVRKPQLNAFRPTLIKYRLVSMILGLMVLVFCAPVFSLAQSSTATLSGTVEDQSGAVIPGANIALVNTGQGTQHLATTNEEGRFVFPLLLPGHYSLTVTRDGFAPQTKTVVLNVNAQVLLRIILTVGPVSQTVEILNDAPLINESPAVATVINRQFLENVPLNGRSVQPLISLTPGTVMTKSAFTDQGQFSVNGQRTDANYFTVDGASANIGVSLGTTITQTGAGSIPAFSASGGTNNLVSVDAMEEFKVMTSTFAPEFGRTPGAQVQIVTRSGTNRFSGTLFEYFRNDVLDANDWFANRSGFVRPPLRQNDFGGVLSGPILLPRFGEGGRQPWFNGRNRTFFFFSYEGLRLRQPQFKITKVPSMAARASAVASIRPFLNAFPIPNGPVQPNGFADFAASYSNPTTLNATSIRIDHSINSRFNLFGRYNYAPSSVEERGGSGTSLNHIIPQSVTTQTVTLGLTASITHSIVSETRANYSRNQGAFSVIVDSFGGATPLPASVFPPAPYTLDEALLIFSITGGTNTVLNLGNNASHLQQQLNFTNNFSKVLTAHQLKFGVDYRQLTPFVRPRKYQQSAFFTNVTAANGAATPGTAASGIASIARVVATENNKLFITNFSAYGQDTWHLSPRFTLTYGLRWDLNPPPSAEADLITLDGLDNPSTLSVAPVGTPLYATTYDNFAPRIGVAYQLSQTPGRESVVRGGLGIFYDLGIGNLGNAAFSFPYSRTRNLLPNTPFPFSAANAAPLPFSLDQQFSDVNIADRNLKLPRVYQWNLALEQSLGASQTLSLSYVAALGRRLLRQEQFVSPTPKFSIVNVTRNSGTSDYHGMQAQFSRRLSRGLQALASYTWSHSLDNGSTDSISIPPGEKLDPDTDRGPSDFDVRHTLTGAVTYNVPVPNLGAVVNAFLHDWSIDTILTSRSATPVNVTVTRNLGFGSFSSFRPDLIEGVPLYVADPTFAGGRRINRLAFVTPTALRQGSLGRNALRGFPMWQLDLALRRQFSLTDEANLQFRAEFFNVFNHPNFGDPGAGFTGTNTLTNASFGQSLLMLGRALGTGGGNGGFNPLYQIGGPRSIQFALKLSF